jgi:hypothetical protein
MAWQFDEDGPCRKGPADEAELLEALEWLCASMIPSSWRSAPAASNSVRMRLPNLTTGGGCEIRVEFVSSSLVTLHSIRRFAHSEHVFAPVSSLARLSQRTLRYLQASHEALDANDDDEPFILPANQRHGGRS